MFLRRILLSIVSIACVVCNTNNAHAETTHELIEKIVHILRLRTARDDSLVEITLQLSDNESVHISHTTIGGTQQRVLTIIHDEIIESVRTCCNADENIHRTQLPVFEKKTIRSLLVDFEADGVLDEVYRDRTEDPWEFDIEDEQAIYNDLVRDILATLEFTSQKS